MLKGTYSCYTVTTKILLEKRTKSWLFRNQLFNIWQFQEYITFCSRLLAALCWIFRKLLLLCIAQLTLIYIANSSIAEAIEPLIILYCTPFMQKWHSLLKYKFVLLVPYLILFALQKPRCTVQIFHKILTLPKFFLCRCLKF